MCCREHDEGSSSEKLAASGAGERDAGRHIAGEHDDGEHVAVEHDSQRGAVQRAAFGRLGAALPSRVRRVSETECGRAARAGRQSGASCVLGREAQRALDISLGCARSCCESFRLAAPVLHANIAGSVPMACEWSHSHTSAQVREGAVRAGSGVGRTVVPRDGPCA